MTADELVVRLTNVGLAVDGMHQHGDDYILDLDLTSNRPDCLSHFGVARELAAIQNTELEIKEVTDESPNVDVQNVVTIEDPDLCYRFTARLIQNVKIGPSPKWLVDRLEAVGERSINNIADITNYVMLELGQPMHSFDLDKLTKNRIVVRRARSSETITTLDEVERDLDDTMLAICDAEKPVAIGGVMGGWDTGITEKTVNVLLEVAYFDRANIRATSRKLNLATEASYRFERGVDINALKRASDRATELICDLAGGEKGEFIDVYPTRLAPKDIASADIAGTVKRLTGLPVSTEECDRILSLLGIESKQNSTIFVSPSWRHDIGIEEDLVEEVTRHIGYEKIADELPPAYCAGEYQPTEAREKLLRQTLADMGFDEAVSYSFIDTRFDDVFEIVPGLIDDNAAERYVTLQNAVIEGAVRMRPSILPGLLDAVRHNFNHQRRDIRLFEIGNVFAGGSGDHGLPNERKALALVITGGELLAKRAVPDREFDLYDASGAIAAALNSLGMTDPEFSAGDVNHLRPGQSAAISVDGNTVGFLGRLSDHISAEYKFRQPIYLAEIDLSSIMAQPPIQIVYEPLAKYPVMFRDISFVVKRKISYASIRQAILEQKNELCKDLVFIHTYEGKGLAEDERSVTIRLEYKSDERTLVEDEVELSHERIIANVEQKLGISRRS